MAQRAGRAFFTKLWNQQQQLWKQGIGNTTSSSSSSSSCQRFSPFQQNPSPRNPLGFKQYYTDAQGVVHFKRRGPTVWIQEVRSGGGRPQQQKKLLIIVGGVGAVCTYVYYTNLQTVPYTHRKHFVLIGPALERQLGEQEFSNIKAQMAQKILPPIHPQAVRIRRIAREVIEAAMAGTKTQSYGELEQHTHIPHPSSDSPPTGLSTSKVQRSSEDVYGNERLEDDMWVDKSRKKGLDEGSQGFTAHLNNLKWEVIVVDEDIMNAFCLPGGKIVVFTGLLKLFRSDTEIATVLGHEVGHVVGRHVAEKLTRGFWLGFLQLIILSFVYVPELISSTSNLLVALPFSRLMESEADHIGLMLMAAAGYDPTYAPAFYEKMGKLGKQPEYLQYVNTHPSGRKRAEALQDSNTMQEAVRIYSDKIAGQGQHGFL